jgi:hypothetical protein
MQLRRKRFDHPDEVRTVDKAHIDLVEGSLSMPQRAFLACRSRAKSWSPPPSATSSPAQDSSSPTGASSSCAV